MEVFDAWGERLLCGTLGKQAREGVQREKQGGRQVMSKANLHLFDNFARLHLFWNRLNPDEVLKTESVSTVPNSRNVLSILSQHSCG